MAKRVIRDIPTDNLSDLPEEEPAADAMLKMLAARNRRADFQLWVIGDTPLICHAWSQKAKLEMLATQTKATRGAKEPRDPQEDFTNSLYLMPDGFYGFPVTALKSAIESVAHVKKGVAKSEVRKSLFFKAEMIRAYTACADAICDMPVVRIFGSTPEMREDMGRVGGMNSGATLIYRAQFTLWAMRLVGHFDPNVISQPVLSFLIDQAGSGCGIGDWRIEKSGMFGGFHLARPDEEAAWQRFADGGCEGPVPTQVERAAA